MRLRPVLLVVAALGCGPSFHAIYEGNARFEHCYALEETTQSTMKERADCWRDWSERYTYGQTRDRIQYATARYVALSQAPNVPTDEALMMAAPGMTPRVTTITAPAPTSPYHPPPKVLDETDGMVPHSHASEQGQMLGMTPDAATGPAPVPAPALPAEDCSARCSDNFRMCAQIDGAPDGGKARSAPAVPDGGPCEKAYKTCMRGCFK